MPAGKAWAPAPKGTAEVIADPKTGQAIAFQDQQHFLMGSEATVKTLYERVQKGGVKSDFAGAVDLAAQHQVVVAIAPETLYSFFSANPQGEKIAPEPPPQVNPKGEAIPPPPPPKLKPDRDRYPPVRRRARKGAAECLARRPAPGSSSLQTAVAGEDHHADPGSREAETSLTARLDYADEADARDGEAALQHQPATASSVKPRGGHSAGPRQQGPRPPCSSSWPT